MRVKTLMLSLIFGMLSVSAGAQECLLSEDGNMSGIWKGIIKYTPRAQGDCTFVFRKDGTMDDSSTCVDSWTGEVVNPSPIRILQFSDSCQALIEYGIKQYPRRFSSRLVLVMDSTRSILVGSHIEYDIRYQGAQSSVYLVRERNK